MAAKSGTGKAAATAKPVSTTAKPASNSKSATSAKAILDELRPLGSDSYKKILLNHGVKEPCFGVKIEEMKKIQKRVKQDYRLALDLFDSGNYDAMYLAGLVADDLAMTREDLQRWAERANSKMLSEYTVPWVAAESQHGRELALKWIDSKQESVASSGWATLSALVALKEDSELDLAELERLLQRVEKTIHSQSNRVKYVMNGFVIAVGSYVKPLNKKALQTAAKVGKLTIDVGDTDCRIPDAAEQIGKIEKRGALGKKRKTAKC